mgnify:CR=1 FL=1
MLYEKYNGCFWDQTRSNKMCPLVLELRKRPDNNVIVCVTGQHRQMLDQILADFNVVPDIDLHIMKEKQTLFDITINVMNGIKDVIKEVKPDIVLVHGDTSTTFATALACFYLKIPVGHVEAGLRTYKIAAFSLKLYQTNIPVENFATISSICILMPPYKPNAFKAIIL